MEIILLCWAVLEIQDQSVVVQCRYRGRYLLYKISRFLRGRSSHESKRKFRQRVALTKPLYGTWLVSFFLASMLET